VAGTPGAPGVPTPANAPAALAPTIKPGTAAATAIAPGRESAKDRRTREARERDARERDARIAANLVAPATGTVRIAISPWGLVEVDGAASGAAPPITELTLAEGRHQIVVRNGDYAPHTVSINVTAGQTISVRHKFGS
jgi:serine/threonine-protein kinase